MNTPGRITIAALGTVALLAAAPPLLRQGTTYHVTKSIALPGDGGWDYLTVDSDARRVYISRGSLNQVQVVDLATDKLVGTIDSTRGVHGIALAPEFNRFNHTGRNTTAIDAATGKVLGTAKTDGVMEAGATDLAGTIFANDEDSSRVFVFDAKTLAIKGVWPLAGCTAPTGMAKTENRARTMALDEKTHRLYTVTAQYNAPPAPPAGAPAGRGGRATVVPGTFHLLVLEK